LLDTSTVSAVIWKKPQLADSTSGLHAASGFERDADGWTVTGDAQEEHVQPDYAEQGSTPDGPISAVDDATDGIWYLQAPAKYLGDASGKYANTTS
jgi:hypothetical protein